MSSYVRPRGKNEPDRLEEMQVLLIPLVINEVKYARDALELEHRLTGLASITISFEDVGVPDRRTILAAYSQPVIAMGLMRCRYLLEFMGIRTTGTPPTLKAVDRRRNGDISIEDYTGADGQPLARVTPEEAVQMFPQHARIGTAWATVIEIANQRLAHPTDRNKLEGNGMLHDDIALTFDTVPELMRAKFYDALGVQSPSI